jgi:serine/threonine protein kinase
LVGVQVAQEKQMNSVLREIDIMKGVDSPQIVQYYANYYWKKEIWIVMEFCLRARDHQVLTNRGFLFLDQVLAAVSWDADEHRVRDWHGLTVANYDPASHRLVYHTPHALVLRDADQARADSFVEFLAPRANVAIVATAGHDMYFADADADADKFTKLKAADVAARVASAPLRQRLLLAARNGVAETPSLADVALPASCDDVSTAADDAAVDWQALLLCGADAAPPSPDFAGSMSTPLVRALGDVTRAQVTAFLELYGRWLAGESSAFVVSGAADLRFVAQRLVTLGWTQRARLTRAGTRLTVAHALLAQSTRRVAPWAWCLAASALRAIVAGASEANTIRATSVALRDDWLRVLLHCGLSAQFAERGDGVWSVEWSDEATATLTLTAPGAAAGAADEMLVQRSSGGGDDCAWCFNMGGGFVVTRSAVRVSAAAFAELQQTKRALAATTASGDEQDKLRRRVAELSSLAATAAAPGSAESTVVVTATRATIQGNCSRGSLSGVLDKEAKIEPPRGFRDESRIAAVAMGALSGLLYMHRRNVVHRDVKSDNVLIQRDGVIKLADFGISRRITGAEERMGTMIGTPHYLAPEVVLAENEGGYTSKVDVWSLGVICLELADGRPPFADLNPMKVLFELANNPVCKLKDPSKWSQMFSSFTEFCCKAQPAARPSSDHMIKHPFLSSSDGILRFPGDGLQTSAAAGVSGAGAGLAPALPPAGGQPQKPGRKGSEPPNGSPAPPNGVPISGVKPVAKQNPTGPPDGTIPRNEEQKKKKRTAIQLFNKGIEYAQNGQHDEAISMYMQALENDPRHIGSLTNLGVAYINKKDYDSAIKQFLLVCEIRPTDANNFVNVGVAYANKKDYVEALRAFERAIELEPNHAVAKQMLRRCQADQRKSEQRQGGAGGSIGPRNGGAGGGGGGQVAMCAQFDANRDQMPYLLAACVQFLEREEEATNFGIFQEQGDPQVIQDYKRVYDSGGTPPLDQIGSHNVAGLLWMFFHELPEPILTFALRDRWINAAAAANEGGHRAVQALSECISLLPPGSRRALHALLWLLAAIHRYQNAAARLSAFFAEEILWSQTAPPNDVMAARVVELLILYYPDLFHGSPFGGDAPPAAAPPAAVARPQPAPAAQLVSSGGFGNSNGSGAAFGAPAAPIDMTNDPFGYYEPDIVFKRFTRDEAESRLAVSPGGAYLVRPSSQQNCLSVSYKALDTGRIGHLLLSKPSAAVPGWTTDGRPKPYPTIKDLLRSLPYGLNLTDPVIK